MSESELQLEYIPAGSNGTVLLTAKLGDDVVAHDKVDLSKSKARTAFVADLCRDRKGIDAAAVERQLLQLAADEAQRRDRQDEPDEQLVDESAAALKAMPESVKTEAMRMLESPNLFRQIVADIGALGVAGEKELAAAIYLVGTSRILPRPLAAIVQGPSSSGKSYTVEKVASLMPPEAVVLATQMTPQALFHMKPGSLMHRFVVAGERSRVENDERAEATRALREMLSGGRLVKLMPMKVGGDIVTETIVQEGPIAYVESTTLAEIFDEDRNRCILLTTDERREQTTRIVTTLARGYAGETTSTATAAIIDRHHALQRMLQPFTVVVPFAERLGGLIAHDKVECRRAFPQLMSMVQAIALLHQRQRQIDADGRLIASRDDYQLARHLLAKPLGRLLGGKLSDPASRCYNRLVEQFSGDFTTREAVRNDTASERSVRGWLMELHDAGRIDLVEPAKGPKPARWKLTSTTDPDDSSDLPTAAELFPVSDVPACQQELTPGTETA